MVSIAMIKRRKTESARNKRYGLSRLIAAVAGLAMIALLAIGVPSNSYSAQNTGRPNIVLIIADDMGWEDSGPYGHKDIRTPALDRMAARGMRFDNAILTCSSCSPSRSSIITCRYPHNTGAEQLHLPLPKEQTTFVELLKQAGYWTAAVGKWHLGGAVEDRFDVVGPMGTARLDEADSNPKGEKGIKKRGSGNPSGGEGWVPTLRDRPRDKPFFLWLAAFDPHRGYAPNAIPEPHKPADALVPPYLPDTPEVRQDLALYYDEISRLDSFVGKVLDELERQKIADNTVVMFMTDNGRPFPRCKTTVYDSGVKTPLIVHWPAKVKAGRSTPALVSSIDIGATILDVAGLKPAEVMQGRSFAHVLSDPQQTAREYVFSEHNWHDYEARSRSVRTARYKYIRNEYRDLPNTPPADAVRSPTYAVMQKLRDAGQLTPAQMVCFTVPLPAEELYDLESDPHELNNLAGESSHAEVLGKLRGVLDAWKAETKDVAPAQRRPDGFHRDLGTQLPNRRPKR